MTPPARVPNTLDLAADPQLVHDFAETFNAPVGHKRVKILQFVPAMRFHSVEDEAGMFAQLMHGDVSVIRATLSTDMQLGLSPHSIFMTTAWVFRPAALASARSNQIEGASSLSSGMVSRATRAFLEFR